MSLNNTTKFIFFIHCLGQLSLNLVIGGLRKWKESKNNNNNNNNKYINKEKPNQGKKTKNKKKRNTNAIMETIKEIVKQLFRLP